MNRASTFRISFALYRIFAFYHVFFGQKKDGNKVVIN